MQKGTGYGLHAAHLSVLRPAYSSEMSSQRSRALHGIRPVTCGNNVVGERYGRLMRLDDNDDG